MTANRTLAASLGIDEHTCLEIDKLHESIFALTRCSNLGLWDKAIHNDIRDLEFKCQKLWGFSENEKYHKHTKEYEFRTQWAGRVFKCEATGHLFVIPDDVCECQWYTWGGKGAYVDVGRLNAYSRHSGCVEIKGEE